MELHSSSFFPSLYVFLLLVCAWSANAQPFYVATNGNDSNGGTLSKPFLTITRAQEAVLSLPPQKQPITVYIRGGDYVQQTPLAFTQKNSGTEISPVQYIGYPGETARILGGVELSNGWTQVDDDVAADNGLAPEVVQINLKKLGITDYGELTHKYASRLELFFNDTAMTLARYPNVGKWLFTQKVENTNVTFTYNDTRASKWTNATDPWLHGYWSWDWADSYVHILSIDTSNSTFHTDPETLPIYGYTASRRYYALNLLVELDQPGEYYLERTTGILYFYPPAPITSAKSYVSMQSNVITLNTASYLLFKNLVIMYSRMDAVMVNGGTNVVFDHCLIANSGQDGIVFSQTTNSGMINGEVFGTGDSGISVSGGNRYTLVSGFNTVFNNTIHDFSRLDRTYQPGVAWGGVGGTVSYNNIYSAPHSGILGGGNNYIFEYNYLHDLVYETSDAGAFYTGRSWSMQGNVFRYNYVKNIRKTTITFSGGTVQGIYLDDEMSGYQVYGNIVENCELGFMLGGGRNTQVYNNTFKYNGYDIEFDNRGMTWQKPYCTTGGQLQVDLATYNFLKPPYSTAYPWIVTYLTNDPCTPVGNVIQNNQYCNETTFINQTPATVSSWQSVLQNNKDIC